jgi:protein-disulfide isomerase
MQENSPSRTKKIGKWLLLGILTIFLGFIFAFTFAVIKIIKSGAIQKNQSIKSSSLVDEKNLQAMVKNSYSLGGGGKVVIIEFGDFSCPRCKESFSNVREIGQKFKNDVKIYFKDFPVVSESSATLALAARCAGEQGLFWPMYDKLYINQGVTTEEQLTELAKQIGADTNRFTICFNNKKYLSDIRRDYNDGTTLGLTGTPSWFINGEKIEGAIPHDIFIKNIELLINGK